MIDKSAIRMMNMLRSQVSELQLKAKEVEVELRVKTALLSNFGAIVDDESKK